MIPYVDTLSRIIRQYGNNQSLWMAEVGYSTYRKPDGYVSNSYRSTYDYEHTPEFQAVAMWRTLTMLLSTNQIAAIAWYEIKDLPPAENVIGDVNNRNLGVDCVGWKPKPAEHALSFFNEFFMTPSRCIDRSVKVTRPRNSASEVHTFEMEDGSLAVVAWIKTNIPGQKPKGEIGNLKDTRKETIALAIPSKAAGAGTLYTEQGEAAAFSGLSAKGGTVQVKELSLTAGQIAILKIAN